MREITLKIPDKKFSFFMELIKQLGIEVSEKEDEKIVTVRAVFNTSRDPEIRKGRK